MERKGAAEKMEGLLLLMVLFEEVAEEVLAAAVVVVPETAAAADLGLTVGVGDTEGGGGGGGSDGFSGPRLALPLTAVAAAAGVAGDAPKRLKF